MVTINTNLSSLIVQNNLGKSTNVLNLAIERMTTGFKLNHAADNAAEYSIAQDMSSKISSYGIAQDNIAMGMDMVATAQDSISLMQSHGERIMALWNQAQNGTYGNQSLQAIQSEVNARMAEIERLYNTTEYNGISLLGYDMPDWTNEVKAIAGVNAGAGITTNESGFIDDIVTVTPDVIVTDPTQLASAISSNTKIGIGNAETLAKLAELVNNGTTTCSGKTILLTEDIDLSAYQDGAGWTPIGNINKSSKNFAGTFDGQGHKITNLKINNPTKDYKGLFGYARGEIKNVGVVDVEVNGKSYTGALVGYTKKAITNSYATGAVTGQENYTGGLAGDASSTITNSYTTGAVTGQGDYTGGLAGYASSTITNSYATGAVTGQGDYTGGLAGYASSTITNSYATGAVTGQGNWIGGLVGDANSTITNSYATGAVTGQGYCTGGLAGLVNRTITNSYATGAVTGKDTTGGLAGYASAITNSYATGAVTGKDGTGGLAGYASAITNSYATGAVTGANWTGGLVGQLSRQLSNPSETLNLDKLCSSGTVTSTTGNRTGSLIGGIYNTTDGSSFTTINITNAFAVSQGNMIGFEGKYDGTAYESGQMEDWLANISSLGKASTTLQVGINGDESCQITFSSKLSLDLNVSDIKSVNTYDSIKSFLDRLSAKATELGAVTNRLDSALESTGVAVENLTSSRSTMKDADIAKESSSYIKAQILQQASATLLATANQSPSIALQLI